jgi:chromate reductase
MKIVTLVGSLRSESYNLKLARTMQDRYSDRFEMVFADLRELPHYDQDDENDPPQSVIALKQEISEADGVLIITPEFNWSIPGALKNALDWLSRVEKVMVNKPVLTAGVSPAMLGTVRAQLHLREILQSPGLSARVLPPGGNEILINQAMQKFDASGRLVDVATLEFLDTVIAKFLAWISL